MYLAILGAAGKEREISVYPLYGLLIALEQERFLQAKLLLHMGLPILVVAEGHFDIAPSQCGR